MVLEALVSHQILSRAALEALISHQILSGATAQAGMEVGKT
ncbi:hypothetical protein sync_0715 [Synechococcus sp. CC9311]|nr:hypothetical protein sync_0715 [Synechococcus sp. CC9311]